MEETKEIDAEDIGKKEGRLPTRPLEELTATQFLDDYDQALHFFKGAYPILDADTMSVISAFSGKGNDIKAFGKYGDNRVHFAEMLMKMYSPVCDSHVSVRLPIEDGSADVLVLWKYQLGAMIVKESLCKGLEVGDAVTHFDYTERATGRDVKKTVDQVLKDIVIDRICPSGSEAFYIDAAECLHQYRPGEQKHKLLNAYVGDKKVPLDWQEMKEEYQRQLQNESADLIRDESARLPIFTVKTTVAGTLAIRIETFHVTPDRFDTVFEALKKVKAQIAAFDPKKIVIDLRGNAGGFLQQTFALFTSFTGVHITGFTQVQRMGRFIANLYMEMIGMIQQRLHDHGGEMQEYEIFEMNRAGEKYDRSLRQYQHAMQDMIAINPENAALPSIIIKEKDWLEPVPDECVIDQKCDYEVIFDAGAFSSSLLFVKAVQICRPGWKVTSPFGTESKPKYNTGDPVSCVLRHTKVRVGLPHVALNGLLEGQKVHPIDGKSVVPSAATNMQEVREIEESADETVYD